MKWKLNKMKKYFVFLTGIVLSADNELLAIYLNASENMGSSFYTFCH